MISMPKKGILPFTGSSIVNVRLGCRPFRVVRNTVVKMEKSNKFLNFTVNLLKLPQVFIY